MLQNGANRTFRHIGRGEILYLETLNAIMSHSMSAKTMQMQLTDRLLAEIMNR